MSKILVTGSKGVIGSKLVEVLKKRGHEVFGIDLHHSDGEEGFEQKMDNFQAGYARCDISEFRQLERIFNRFGPFEYVFNTAAEFGRWNGEDFYEQVWKTNAIGLKHILRLQEKLKFKLIHCSSSEVYGDYPGIMSEEIMDKVEIKQMNDYAMSKWVNEMQIKNSLLKHGTETVIIRYFNTGGEGEWYHSYRSVNAKFCYNLLMGRPITVYKGHTRTSLWVWDAVETTANVIDNFISGEVYNIGGEDHHTIEELAELALKYTKADPKLVKYKGSEILTTKHKRIDLFKARKELNHKPTVGLDEQVKRTVEWMRKYYGLAK